MSFDLYVWPIDRQVTQEEAASELERLSDYDRPREATDPRLRAFVAELRARFPEGFPDKSEIDADWQPPEGTVVFELNESREHAFLGIPWSFVSPVGAAAQEIAFRHDLMLFDPQSEMAILPPTFGGEPIDWTAPDDSEVEAMANDFSAKVAVDLSDLDLDNDTDAMRALVREIEASGGRMEVPMGFRVTEDLVSEVFDDPNRLPSKLQTPETKARLLANIRSPKNRPRMEAVTQLAGWDADDEVDAALAEALRSDDGFVRWIAASGLARHGYVAAFEDVLEVTRRSSPAGDGDVGSMIMPTQSALELATRIGPQAVERVRALVAEWRGPVPAKPKQWDRELDRVLRGE